MTESSLESFTVEEGKWLVKTARKAAETFVEKGERISIPDDTPAIGRPEPNQSLVEALIDSAIDSATRDPRFEPMTSKELEESTFEVSVLTVPMPVQVKNPLEYKNKIVIGRDGLIVEWDYGA